MRLEILNEFIGKNVFVMLKKGIIYNGVILAIEADDEVIFVKMRERFGRIVLFLSSEIIKIEVTDGGRD